MLGIDKDHSLNSASLDGTNVFFMLVKCVFHDVIIKLLYYFSKRMCYCTLCFVSLELFIKWKIDLLEKTVVVTT